MKKSKLGIIQDFLDKHNILSKMVDCDTMRDKTTYNRHFIDHDEWVIMGQVCSASNIKGYTHMQTLLLSRRNKPFTLKVGDIVRISWDGYKLHTA